MVKASEANHHGDKQVFNYQINVAVPAGADFQGKQTYRFLFRTDVFQSKADAFIAYHEIKKAFSDCSVEVMKFSAVRDNATAEFN